MRQLPQQLLNSISALPGYNEQAFIEAHSEANKITSIRLNPFKPTELDFPLGKAVPWFDGAFYLNERPSFTLDPLFHAGCYYVQEAGSMFLGHALKSALDFSQELKVLDVCAAPGGKSTLLNSLLSAESLLVSNEVVRNRAEILSDQLGKWGTCNTLVTNSDPSRFAYLEGFFDVLVVDAPCSGSGLFRRQPEAIDEWSPDAVKACSIRQQSILEQVVPLLKEDGLLFYSTCSYSKEENEDIVKLLMLTHSMEWVNIPLGQDWGLVQTDYGFRFYPHLALSEGFFCALLRKKSSSGSPSKSRQQRISKPEANVLSVLKEYVEMGENELYKLNDQLHFMNKNALNFLLSSDKNLYFKKAGTVAGEIKGRDFIPHHELALSLNVKQNLVKYNLTLDEALKYLRKEPLMLEKRGKGFSLVSYKQMGLGWAKILDNRTNNYLPNHARVLK